MPFNKRGYSIKSKNSDSKSAEIFIYDEIGAFNISASAFVTDLNALNDVKKINVRINSPGGAVFDGVTIFNSLKRHPATINVFVDGLAASAASLIAMAGDTVSIADNAMMMVHNPWTIVMGDAIELRAQADMMDKAKDGMIISYAAKTGLTYQNISNIMDNETWLTAQESVDLGFADNIIESSAMAAKFDLDRFKFKNAPDCIKGGCGLNDWDVGKLTLTDMEKIKQMDAIADIIKTDSNHNSDTVDDEPELNSGVVIIQDSDIDKKYNHHYIDDGGVPRLHAEALALAWATAQGAGTGNRACQKTLDHLGSHRADIGIESDAGEMDRLKSIVDMANVYLKHNPDEDADTVLGNLRKAASIATWEKTALMDMLKRKLELADIK